MPPAPHLLGDEGHERGEQLLQHRQRGPQRPAGRGGRGRAVLAVGTGLHQFDVVVGEGPAERLGALQSSGVVEGLQGPGGVGDEVGEAVQHRAVQRLGDLATAGIVEAQHELRDVEQLDGEAPADAELLLVEGGVGAGAPARGPVAHRVGAVALQQLGGHLHVAPRLRHLLAVGVEDPARQRAVVPRDRAGVEVGPHHGGEQPGADDVVGLGPHVHREGGRVEGLVGAPAGGDLWGQRRGGPGVHHVGVADEPAGNAPLGLVVERWAVRGRVHGKGGLLRLDRGAPHRRAVGVEAVPQRDGHPEEALAADEPVAVEPRDPALVAGPHVARHPVHLRAPVDQGLAEVGVAPAVADVPLPAGHDLEGLVALLEELDRVGDGAGLAVNVAGLGEDGCDLGAGRRGGLAGQSGVGSPARR